MAQRISEIAVAARLEDYFENRIGKLLKDRRKRESFAMYSFGILGDGERKSVEPIAARACGDPRQTNNLHSKLLYFLGESVWDDRGVRLEAARYAIDVVQQREPVTTWIIDDTGFLKQGNHSVGVQRQYTGSAGKITNCQIGVSLAVATDSEQIPVDFELYLPESWTEDRVRRREAHIPEQMEFKTKIELAMEMMGRARAAGIPGDVLLADAAYGNSGEFRAAVRQMGFDYAVGVQPQTLVRRVDAIGRDHGTALTCGEMIEKVGRGVFRNLTWREGTKYKLSGCFYFARVKSLNDNEINFPDRESLWLIVEWPSGEAKPTHYLLSTLPKRMSKKQIVRILKGRWRTERMYEDLKGELGLDHFEGRSFPGWHHHVSVVLCCYAFVVAERSRSFPPSAIRAYANRALSIAA
ncbi:MAG TPA: IS701 family transposase [Polyangiaceae bacterium]